MARHHSLTLKDHLRESLLFQRRILVAILFLVLLLAGLLSRMFYLQITNHEHYTSLSENNRVSIVPISPIRGLIYDRNGVLLAQNLPSRTLELIPEHIKDLDATLITLRSLIQISDEEIERFHKLRRQKRRFEGIPLRFRLNDSEYAHIAVNQDRLPGVEIAVELARHYPQGSLASHAIGYVGRINVAELRHIDTSRYSATKHIGKVGVENAYEDVLHGEVGFQRVETNAAGRVVDIDVENRSLPKPGNHLYLTLDARLQAIAEQAFGEESGALVALDPNDGAVLAFVSMPTFDPNLFVNGVDVPTYRELSNSPARPLFNRALRGQYPPGSTIKPFIGLAALEYKLITEEESIRCPGYYTLKNDERRYRDWKKEGHGETALDKAIVESCDVYFYDLALNLKIDRMESYLAGFHLGRPTGIDIRGEESGLLPGKDWKRRVHNMPWFPGETLITGIGQGFTLTTPLQLAHITAQLSNRGKRYKPHVVHAIRNPGDEELQIQPPLADGAVTIENPANWDKVIHSMVNVVHSLRGTARGINRNLNYTIAGKTGTAQVFGIKEDEEYDEEKIAKKLRDHALFIAFAPAEKPTIAIAVIVENGGSGGAVAAPIARKVIDAYMEGKS